MKKLLSLILFMLLPIAVNAQQQDIQTGDCVVQASQDFARVRSSWNLEADEISRIGATDTARYIARGRNASAGFTWYYIGIGWVRSDVVNVTGNCDNLPVVFTEVTSAFHSDAYPCPADFSGYLSSRLVSGQTSLHVTDHGSPYFVYTLPEMSASVAGFIPNNGMIDRIGIGPLCHEGVVFWEAEAANLSGFIVESNRNSGLYYLNASALTNDPTPSADDVNTTPQTATPTLNRPFKIYEGSPAEHLIFSSDSRLIGGLIYPAERGVIWDVETDQYYLLNFSEPIIQAQFGTQPNQVITVSAQGTLTTWDITTQNALHTVTIPLPENALSFSHATFSPEAERVALSSCTEPTEESCNRTTITVSDVATGAQAAQVARTGDLQLLALSNFGNALASSDGANVLLWTNIITDPLSSRTVPTYNVTFANALTFNPSGSRLLVAGCQETRIVAGEPLACSFSTFGAWTVDENIIETMRGNVFEGTIHALGVASDNQTFVAHTSDAVNTYQLSDGNRIRTYHEPDVNFETVAISPDGNLIASADGQGKIMIWRR